MKNILAYVFSIISFLSLFPSLSEAGAPPPTVQWSIGVCSFFNPANCLQPNSDGSLNISGTVSSTPGIYQYTPLGYCQLTVTSAAAVQTSSCSGGIPVGTKYAIISVVTGAVNILDTGSSPTTSVGFPLTSGAYWSYQADFTALQWIAQSTTATVNFLFYR